MSFDAVDDFAAGGGWDEAARLLGLTTVGIERDKTACRTAAAAGHARICADLVTIDQARFRGVAGRIASPPCQPWSNAGKGLGKLDAPAIEAHLDSVEAASEWLPYPADGWHDPNSPLVLEVVRSILAQRPEWIALEQVREVLPFWRRLCRWLRTLGYRAWCGILDAEMYGVAQTRDRAILIASRNPAHTVSRPPATHHRYVHGRTIEPDLFDDLLPPVTMAQALGWGFDDEPACTVSAGGTATGGAEVFANAAYRRRLASHVAMRTNGENGSGGNIPRSIHDPAPTIVGSFQPSWVETGNNSMVTGRTGSRAGDGDVQKYRRPIDAPAPTLDTNIGSKWTIHCPATTVQGDPRIAPRGHHDRQFNGETIRVTWQEASTLQSFRDGYPWQGSNTKRFEQIGNAVPPLLGVAVLGHLLNRPQWQGICRDWYALAGAA